MTELASFQNSNAPDNLRRILALVVTAELGTGLETLAGEIGPALRKHSESSDLRYAAARGFALASKSVLFPSGDPQEAVTLLPSGDRPGAVVPENKDKSRALAARAVELLQDAVKSGEADFARMDDDFALDPIRGDTGFVEIMKASLPDRRYAAVWSRRRDFEAVSIYGLDPLEHLRRGRKLAGEGYRPVAWSAARTTRDGPLVTASVWHRPVVSEQSKDRLAERQARAAIALVRLGKAEEVWPLLRHSADPRLRSYIINWLNPLGGDRICWRPS